MRIVPKERCTANIGDRFGRLEIIGHPFYAPIGNSVSLQHVVCRCDCGSIIATSIRSMKVGDSISCGCRHLEQARSVNRTHGASSSRLYGVWSGMRQRCKPNGHYRYGGRGIRVCKEWISFPDFRDWAMANGYADHLEIERINNDLGYSPDNCRWATRIEQMRNTSKTMLLFAFGEWKSVPDWAEDSRCAVSAHILYKRIFCQGWGIEEGISSPPLSRSESAAAARSAKRRRSQHEPLD